MQNSQKYVGTMSRAALQKNCPLSFWKIQRKTPVMDSFFGKAPIPNLVQPDLRHGTN